MLSPPPVDRQPFELPAELAFLPLLGFPEEWIAGRLALAERAQVCPVAYLIASGGIDATLYYKALARVLDRRFIEDRPQVDWVGDLGQALREGCALMRTGAGRQWLLAPEGETLRRIARGRRDGLPDFALTTPHHLDSLLRQAGKDEIRKITTENLAGRDASLCARGIHRGAPGAALAGLLLLATLVTCAGPGVPAAALALLFLAGMLQRACAAFAAYGAPPPARRTLRDTELPTYTVLVPLHGEAEVVDDLVHALSRIDYPGTKLDIRLILEPDDAATRSALARHDLPAWMRIVLAPEEDEPRTKPRALNAGLIGARGTLVAVFDAEDRPHSGQLRAAAARFAADPGLAALQAPLRIEGSGLLTALFRMEFAALFEVFNPGLACLGWPLPLGGSSNHLRREVLEAVHGWDAWNVTEDADLGLRLARHGLKIGILENEATWETPPLDSSVWFRQRQRWMKGWLQTFCVLARDPRRLHRELGTKRLIVVALMFVNMILGPLMRPILAVLLVLRLGFGIGHAPTVLLGIAALGFGLSIVFGAVGLMRLHSRANLAVAALFPLYETAVGCAAWAAVVGFFRRPQHWYKTPHAPRR